MTFGLIHSLDIGGAEKQMRFLKASGIVDRIYTLESGLDASLHRDSECIGTKGNQSGFRKIVSILVAGIRLSRLAKQGDTGVSFLERANIVNCLASLITKHRVIVSIRTNPVRSFTGAKKIQLFFIRYLYRAIADYVVVNSKGVAWEIEQLGIPSNRIIVIPNSVDIDAVQAGSVIEIPESHARIFNDSIVYVSVGRLVTAKGYEFLIRAFSKAYFKNNSIRLCILGDGTLRESLIIQAKELGLLVYRLGDTDEVLDSASVIFLGAVPNPYPYMKRAVAVVSSSLWEGFPNVVIEALACGSSVISSDCEYGPREILIPSENSTANSGTEVVRTSYGYLLPVFGGDEAEALWVDTLSKCDMTHVSSDLCIQRAQDFSSESIQRQWYTLCNERRS